MRITRVITNEYGKLQDKVEGNANEVIETIWKLQELQEDKGHRERNADKLFKEYIIRDREKEGRRTPRDIKPWSKNERQEFMERWRIAENSIGPFEDNRTQKIYEELDKRSWIYVHAEENDKVLKAVEWRMHNMILGESGLLLEAPLAHLCLYEMGLRQDLSESTQTVM